MKQPAGLTPRQQQFMSILAGQPDGINGAALGRIAGLGQQRSSEVLRMLRRLGLAKCSGPGCGAKWFTTERFAALERADKIEEVGRRRFKLTRRNLQCFCREEGGCWLWTGSVNAEGYPMVSHGGRHQLAKRVIYELFYGPVEAGKVVASAIEDEKCDRLCVRPVHLQQWGRSQLVSVAQRNVNRSYTKDLRARMRQGTKLDYEKARAIRTSDESTEVLAERFGVHRSTIVQCRRGILWRESVPNSSVFNLAQV